MKKVMTYHIQLASEERCTAVLCLALVRRMVLKEVSFMIEGSSDSLAGFDISLATVDNWDITQAQGNNATSKNINNVCALVPTHEVSTMGTCRRK